MTALPDDGDDWRTKAHCRSADNLDVFYPNKDDFDAIRAAKNICRQCPVVTECLQTALDNGEPFGIWGGYLPEERETIRIARRLPKRVPPDIFPHGTEAGYRRHHRAGEPPCATCIRGNLRHRRERERNRGAT